MEIIGLILITILALLISPLLNFFYGYIIGYILRMIMGSTLIIGFQALGFNISPEQIPIVFGMISLIFGFVSSATHFRINKNVDNSKLNF